MTIISDTKKKKTLTSFVHISPYFCWWSCDASVAGSTTGPPGGSGCCPRAGSMRVTCGWAAPTPRFAPRPGERWMTIGWISPDNGKRITIFGWRWCDADLNRTTGHDLNWPAKIRCCSKCGVENRGIFYYFFAGRISFLLWWEIEVEAKGWWCFFWNDVEGTGTRLSPCWSGDVRMFPAHWRTEKPPVKFPILISWVFTQSPGSIWNHQRTKHFMVVFFYLCDLNN